MGKCKGKVNSRRIENNVAILLKLRGISCAVVRTATGSPFDVLTNQGQRIEVKASAYRSLQRGDKGWRFSIHRHGVLNEKHVDWYVLHCGPTPHGDFGKTGFYLVLRAPLRRKTLMVTPRSLFKKKSLHRNLNAFHRIANVELRRERKTERKAA